MSTSELNTTAKELLTAAAYIDVPRGCCVTIAVKNVNTQAIELQNASVIVTRVC